MELTNVREWSKLFSRTELGAWVSYRASTEDSGLADTPLVLQCARQAANKERSVKLQCRPSEASFSGGAAR